MLVTGAYPGQVDGECVSQGKLVADGLGHCSGHSS